MRALIFAVATLAIAGIGFFAYFKLRHPPANDTVLSAIPDYSAKLVDWVQSQQEYQEAPNRWDEYSAAVLSEYESWEQFTKSNGHLAKFLAENPKKYQVSELPYAIINDPAYASLVPDLKQFLSSPETSRNLLIFDELTQPSRFVAPKATVPLLDILKPEEVLTRLVTKMRLADIRLAAADRDFNRVERSLRHIIAASKAVMGRGTYSSVLASSNTIRSLDFALILEILNGNLRGTPCDSIGNELERFQFPSRGAVVEGERLVSLDTIDRFFFNLRLLSKQKGLPAELPETGIGILASHEEQLKQANRFFDAWTAAFDNDPARRKFGDVEIDAVTKLFDDDTGKKYDPVSLTIPDIDKFSRDSKRARTIHDGTIVMLALEVYHARNSRYPDQLNQLVPLHLDKIPEDMYQRGTPLKYLLLDEKSADPSTGYVLYSAGWDGKDDGGKLFPGGNINSSIAPSKGHDFILNTPQ